MSLKSLQTTTQESIILKTVGLPNVNSGPDFFNAQLSIGTQMWAGNVEIHVKSSDWYVHHHETDAAYDSVILHVVWEHDMDIYEKTIRQFQPLNSKTMFFHIPIKITTTY